VALSEGADFPVGRAGGAERLLGVWRTGFSCQARTGLLQIALARGGAADIGVRLHHVVRTVGTRPGALLIGIAHVPRAVSADDAVVTRRVLAGHAGSVALIERADLPVVRARRGRRLLGVWRTRFSRRARTGFLLIALALGGP